MVETTKKASAAPANGIAEPTQKWKIPPVHIESDDCAVYVGRVIEDGEVTEEGTPYYVHQGEWVELIPCRTLAELMALTDIGNMAQEGADSLRKLCQELAKRITAWNWTGMDTEAPPMPQPYNAPEVLEGLTDDELMWLMAAAKGKETSADRKNA